jgi:L-histidine Nalpha-methyltransferase
MRLQTPVTVDDEITAGLSDPVQKRLPAHYLYDDAGSALFEAITELPEYGLTRADERLLLQHAADIVRLTRAMRVVDLGSGSGVKARLLLNEFGRDVIYMPIDVSSAALKNCVAELSDFTVETIESEYLPGLRLASDRRGGDPILVTFLGSNIGNFEKRTILPFLHGVRQQLRSGDHLLIGIDLVKPVPQLIAAYDDASGVTAEFNRNLLRRLNHDFGANFDIEAFDHEVRWNEDERRIEMHLRARRDQRVIVRDLQLQLFIEAGETIHTESSHKFEVSEFENLADAAGFRTVAAWIDEEWPFAEMLFRV